MEGKRGIPTNAFRENRFSKNGIGFMVDLVENTHNFFKTKIFRLTNPVLFSKTKNLCPSFLAVI